MFRGFYAQIDSTLIVMAVECDQTPINIETDFVTRDIITCQFM